MRRALLAATLALLASTVATVVLAEESPLNEEATEEFLSLFDYELQNRAFSIGAIGAIREHMDELELGADTARFWQAYYELELKSRTPYAPVAEKHGLGVEPTWSTEAKVWASGILAPVFPGLAASATHKAAVRYLDKLVRLRELAPKSDSDFFDYVVSQEEAQADALGRLVEDDPAGGAEVLENFLRGERRDGLAVKPEM